MKLFRAALALVFVCSALLPAQALSEDPLPAEGAAAAPAGDVNGDGAVTAADAALILRVAGGYQSAGSTLTGASDINGNMNVNRDDATAVLLLGTGLLRSLDDLNDCLSGSLLGDRYAQKFSYTGVRLTETSYRSDRISLTKTLIRYDDSNCYVFDIWLRDITCFRSAFSSGKYRGERQTVKKMAEKNEALLAINGDFYANWGNGPVIRDGKEYKTTVDDRVDICILYDDGRMITYDKGVSMEEIRNGGTVWQSFVFGPALLDGEGKAKTAFNCAKDIQAQNPRTAVGYYEPGHYCFVTVDGRKGRTSRGLTMEQFSLFFESLGCTAAYNLDGGKTAVMVYNGKVVNEPDGGGRTCSDILYIGLPLS